MPDNLIAAIINSGARFDNSAESINALNLITIPCSVLLRAWRDMILSLLNRPSLKTAVTRARPSTANEQVALRRRNWAAAVSRKSSGVKRAVSAWNNELIHLYDTSSLAHTYSTGDKYLPSQPYVFLFRMHKWRIQYLCFSSYLTNVSWRHILARVLRATSTDTTYSDKIDFQR